MMEREERAYYPLVMEDRVTLSRFDVLFRSEEERDRYVKLLDLERWFVMKAAARYE